jgi:hypothetical protein
MSTLVRVRLSKENLVPGEPAHLVVDILNRSDVVEAYDVRVLGSASAWAHCSEPRVSLFPSHRGSLTFELRPPAGPQQPSGPIVIGVIVSPESGRSEAVVEELHANVLPYHDVSALLRPRISRGARRGRHSIQITNRGNVAVTVELDGQPAEEGVRLRHSEVITVHVGESVNDRLLAIPDRRPLVGGPRLHQFQLTLAGPFPDPVPLEGAFRQVPRLRPGFIAVVAALTLLSVGVIFVARPTSGSPTSTASARPASADSESRQQSDANEPHAESASDTLPNSSPGDDATTPDHSPTPQGPNGPFENPRVPTDPSVPETTAVPTERCTPPGAPRIGAPESIAAGETVTFSDNTLGAHTPSWSFAGANPVASGERQPRVTWTAAGRYSVTLTVSTNPDCPTRTERMVVTVIPPLTESRVRSHPVVESGAIFGATGTHSVASGLTGLNCVVNEVVVELLDRNYAVQAVTSLGAPDAVFGTTGARITRQWVGQDRIELSVQWWYGFGQILRYQIFYRVTGNGCSVVP